MSGLATVVPKRDYSHRTTRGNTRQDVYLMLDGRGHFRVVRA